MPNLSNFQPISLKIQIWGFSRTLITASILAVSISKKKFLKPTLASVIFRELGLKFEE
jgi:hypothetical protein